MSGTYTFLGLGAVAMIPENGSPGELVDPLITLNPGMTRQPGNPYVFVNMIVYYADTCFIVISIHIKGPVGGMGAVKWLFQ